MFVCNRLYNDVFVNKRKSLDLGPGHVHGEGEYKGVLIREAFIKKNKKNYGKFHNRSDPPLTPLFWQKLWKILKNINYFMASKSGLVLK